MLCRFRGMEGSQSLGYHSLKNEIQAHSSQAGPGTRLEAGKQERSPVDRHLADAMGNYTGGCTEPDVRKRVDGNTQVGLELEKLRGGKGNAREKTPTGHWKGSFKQKETLLNSRGIKPSIMCLPDCRYL